MKDHISCSAFVSLVLLLAAFAFFSCQTEDDLDAVNLSNWGDGASISLAPDGSANISFEDMNSGVLLFANYTGDKWTIETASPSVTTGAPTIIATLSSGEPVIAFSDYVVVDDIGKGNLLYATRNGDEWTVEEVETKGDVWLSSFSLAFDAEERPHLCYWERESKSLIHCEKTTAGWDKEVIFSNQDYYDDGGWINISTSIVIDSNDVVHVFHTDYYQISYATNIEGNWNQEIVSETGWINGRISAAVDSNDDLHVAYAQNDEGDSTDCFIRYLTNNSGNWVETKIAPTCSNTSITVDAVGKAHLAFGGAYEGGVQYATNVSGSWEVTAVDSGGYVDSNRAIALNKDGIVHIAYPHYGPQTLRTATNASGEWVIAEFE
ncbi:MAG: hypothetical protein JXM70_21890 [Pirellulales bacterium]|nr:hypothetical protein [Pirellulales bacterium]